MFRPEEDIRGYFVPMQGLIERWDLPLARYGDRHGAFKFAGKTQAYPAADRVGAYAHAHPEDPVEGDPAGQSERGCPCRPSPGNSGSHETRCASTLTPSNRLSGSSASQNLPS